MNEELKDKFSIGLSLSITLEEYQKLIEDYGYYINSIYFSLPLGDNFHSRSTIVNEFSQPEKIKLFYKILELMVKSNIKLDCVFNTPHFTNEELYNALKHLKNNIDVSQITCLNDRAQIIKETLPSVELIYSYNNNLQPTKISEISPLFDTIVLGRQFLRNYALVKNVYHNGFQIKLLVNNGCAFNCGGCYGNGGKCERVFRHNLQHHSINEIYATQSFYPFELTEFLQTIGIPIKYIKISNRTSDYQYLRLCLESYIKNIDPSSLVSLSPKYYRLWGRQSNLNPYLNQLDNQEIVKQKKLLLEESRKCISN